MSVIIVGYKSRFDLRTCLTSLKPSLSQDDEVLVVDNNSRDGTQQMIRRFFPWARLICNPENTGYGSGNNLGAREARGRYLAFLNPDTIVDRGWLDPLAVTLDRHPAAGLATAKILLMSVDQSINACGTTIHISGITFCHGLGLSKYAMSQCQNVDAVSGAAFLIRRALFQQLGGFDEDFFLYMEDIDLSWRARLLGYHCLYVPESIVYHGYKFLINPQKVFWEERNRYTMLLKCLTPWTLLCLIPTLLLSEIAVWGFLVLQYPACCFGKIRAYAWVLLHARSILRRRQTTQQLRCVRDGVLISSAAYHLDLQPISRDRIVAAATKVFDALFSVTARLSTVFIR